MLRFEGSGVNQAAQTLSSFACCPEFLDKAPLHNSISSMWNVAQLTAAPKTLLWITRLEQRMENPVVAGRWSWHRCHNRGACSPVSLCTMTQRCVMCKVPAPTQFSGTKKMTVGSPWDPRAFAVTTFESSLLVGRALIDQWGSRGLSLPGPLQVGVQSHHPLPRPVLALRNRGRRDMGSRSLWVPLQWEHSLPLDHQALNIPVWPDAPRHRLLAFLWWREASSRHENPAPLEVTVFVVWGWWGGGQLLWEVCPWERRPVTRHWSQGYVTSFRKAETPPEERRGFPSSGLDNCLNVIA